MTFSKFAYRSMATAALLLIVAVGGSSSPRANGKRIEFTTKSKEAKDYVAQIDRKSVV